MSGGQLEELPAQLIAAAERLGAERTRAGVLETIVRLIPEALPDAEQVSITVPDGGRLVTVAATGSVARQLDEIQYRFGEGPCLIAAREGHRVLVADMAAECRWPRFASHAQLLRVGSVLSLPLPEGSQVAGSLNIASSEAGVFTAQARTIASVLAAQAGLALFAATERERGTSRVAQIESVLALLVHDLRSGLTVILLAQDLLAGHRDRLNPAGQEALDLLGDELRRQQRLLTELVELARAELPWSRTTALLPVVQDAVDRHRRPVPVITGTGAESVLVRIHPLRLRRILANLLDNADRYAGGATAMQVAGTGETARVAVEDAGPGVPAERRESIFTRQMTSPSPPAGGEGSHLGLALSRVHARLAGGDLWVENGDGGGARFVLLLPTAGAHVPVSPTADRFARGDAE